MILKDLLSKEFILNLFYPHCCPVCHRILKNQSHLICQECAVRIHPVREPYCKKCGRPVKTEAELCGDCGRNHRSFTEGRAVWLYDKTMRESILRFKYGGRKEYAEFYGAAISSCLGKELDRWKPDLIIPIPMYPMKKRKRGFNQAEAIALAVGKRSRIPVDPKALRKVKKTSSQKKLGEKERRRNLRNAFRAAENVRGKRILLIDDVFTTGSTMDAAAEILLRAGAGKVYFAVACIAQRG